MYSISFSMPPIRKRCFLLLSDLFVKLHLFFPSPKYISFWETAWLPEWLSWERERLSKKNIIRVYLWKLIAYRWEIWSRGRSSGFSASKIFFLSFLDLCHLTTFWEEKNEEDTHRYLMTMAHSVTTDYIPSFFGFLPKNFPLFSAINRSTNSQQVLQRYDFVGSIITIRDHTGKFLITPPIAKSSPHPSLLNEGIISTYRTITLRNVDHFSKESGFHYLYHHN